MTCVPVSRAAKYPPLAGSVTFWRSIPATAHEEEIEFAWPVARSTCDSQCWRESREIFAEFPFHTNCRTQSANH
jgi:hypothetical protein